MLRCFGQARLQAVADRADAHRMTAWGDDPELLATFRAEVEERLASLQAGLLVLETHSAPRQVVAAMTQVSDVSRQYAVGSRQAAAAAAQLNVLAAELRASIAQFKVS